MASRTAGSSGPAARSIAGRSDAAMSVCVLSPRGPCKSSSPKLRTVMMSPAITLAYVSAAACWRRRNIPCSVNGPTFLGSTGSKIMMNASPLVDRPTLPGLARLEDQDDREPVRDPPHHRAEHEQHQRAADDRRQHRDRDPEQEPEHEAQVHDQLELLVADRLENLVGELWVLLDVLDDHQLHVEEVVDVRAELVGHLVDHLGKLLLYALLDARAHPGREVAPELRVLALHHTLDELPDVRARAVEDLLRELVAVELVEELARAADLRDPLVDRDAAHLRRARGDDPLPADAAVHDPRHLLDLARQELRERREAGQREAAEADRVEQHPDARPVRRVADRAGEQRDREDADQLPRIHAARIFLDRGGARGTAVTWAGNLPARCRPSQSHSHSRRSPAARGAGNRPARCRRSQSHSHSRRSPAARSRSATRRTRTQSSATTSSSSRTPTSRSWRSRTSRSGSLSPPRASTPTRTIRRSPPRTR